MNRILDLANNPADEALVRRILEKLRVCFEDAVNEDAADGIRNVDAIMIAHNFHKLVVTDLMEKKPEHAEIILGIAEATWAKAIGRIRMKRGGMR